MSVHGVLRLLRRGAGELALLAAGAWAGGVPLLLLWLVAALGVWIQLRGGELQLALFCPRLDTLGFRHPFLRTAQAVAVLAAGALVAARTAPKAAGPTSFSLAVLGERERSDGGWDGVDLLRAPEAAVDRFQLNLSPDTDARALVEAQAADGTWERLYLGTLAGHRDYALPAPHAFFAVQGSVRVRMTLSRIGAPPGEPLPAMAFGSDTCPPFPLSDGAPFHAARMRFASRRAAVLELRIRGR